VAQAAAHPLSKKSQRTLPPAAAAAGRPPVLYTIPDTAEYLGCSQMHVYRLIAAGELRAVDTSMPGARRSKTRIRGDDLAAYVERQTSG
jgi:excisionase family DNA binding protein